VVWAGVLAVCVLGAMQVAGEMGISERGAVTISFLTLGFGKLWFALNLREPGSGLLRNEVVSNRWMWGAIGVCTLMLLGAVHLPVLSAALETSPVPVEGWAMMLGLSLVPVVLGQVWLSVRSRTGLGRWSISGAG
jgi:Ca2+-transporting ATPase